MDKARILVADDDVPTRALLCEAFQGAGYDVRWATCGPEVHRLLDSEEFEAVVTDLVMPGMDACDLIRSVSERAEGTVVVLVTGYPSMDTAVQAVHSSVWEYVTKPFDVDGLVACVNAGVRHQRLQRDNQRLLTELQNTNRKLAEQQSVLERRVCQATASFQASNEALRKRVAQLARLNDLAKAINEAHTEEVAIRQIAGAVLDLTPADYCGILLPEPDGSGARFEIHGARMVTDAVREQIAEVMWDAFEIVAAPRLREADAHPLLGSVRDEAAEPLTDLAAALSVQLAVHGEVLGILSVGSARPGVLTDEDHRLLSTIGSQAAAGLESIRAYGWVQNNYLATIQSLAKSLEAKDTYTSGHSSRVAAMAAQVAEAMGLEVEQVAMIHYAATLHDIGKIGVDDSTIRSAERLSAEELQSVRRHPELGEEILRPVQMLRPALPLIRHHHERWDGKGYPDGLSGDQIPLGARIIAVADSFDAMTSERPYRDRLPTTEALRELHANQGTQFDPEIVYAVLGVRPAEPLRPVTRDGALGNVGEGVPSAGPEALASASPVGLDAGEREAAAESAEGARHCDEPVPRVPARGLFLAGWLAAPCALAVALLYPTRPAFGATALAMSALCVLLACEARRWRVEHQRMAELYELAASLSAEKARGALLQGLAARTVELLDADACAVYLRRDGHEGLRADAMTGDQADLLTATLPAVPAWLQTGNSGAVPAGDLGLLVADGSGPTGRVALAWAALHRGEALEGMIVAGRSGRRRAFEAREHRLLLEVAERASTALHKKHACESARQAAALDALTGLLNRREFEHRLRQEVERSERSKTTVSLVMLDVDHFKQVNDRYGHAAGDAVLRATARAVQYAVRGMDIVARYGADVMAVIAPETEIGRAAQLAERLRASVDGLVSEFGAGSVGVTVSVGVASSDLGGGAEGLLHRVHRALDNAKTSGRNRVKVGRGGRSARPAQGLAAMTRAVRLGPSD